MHGISRRRWSWALTGVCLLCDYIHYIFVYVYVYKYVRMYIHMKIHAYLCDFITPTATVTQVTMISPRTTRWCSA
jgi:hypothetical protein